MATKLRLGYFVHSLRSDWNNGNAHFLRGLMRALGNLGHKVTIYEPESEWSLQNLYHEDLGLCSIQEFQECYKDLQILTYTEDQTPGSWRGRLQDTEVVILHEWNPPSLASMLLKFRDELGFKLLFHDTHHRASSSPEQMELFKLRDFDGVIAFGASLNTIYRKHFGLERVWTLHEAADTSIFQPYEGIRRSNSLVWVGNWGDGERSLEIERFLLAPAALLKNLAETRIYGVRYPPEGLAALARVGATYLGYLPNLLAPRVYAAAQVTVHIPRQHYQAAMEGIPTIRVFEALACGIPLVSAPWNDVESLFRTGDFLWAHTREQMAAALRTLLHDPAAAAEQARRGRATVLARHTCAHRAVELTHIFHEVLG